VSGRRRISSCDRSFGEIRASLGDLIKMVTLDEPPGSVKKADAAQVSYSSSSSSSFSNLAARRGWSRKSGHVCSVVFDMRFDFVEDLSRRDYRTEPGVLTPGTSPTHDAPCLSAVVSGMRDEGGKGRKIFVRPFVWRLHHNLRQRFYRHLRGGTFFYSVTWG
jgi:hypothetical protein